MSDTEQRLKKLNKYLLTTVIISHCCQYVNFSICGEGEGSLLSTNSSWNLFIGSQARHAAPSPIFLGSLPSPKPGNLVILIMKKKHVLFKIPAAKYSAMLFLCDSRIALLGNSNELKI